MFFTIVVLYIVYRLLDYLIRIPQISNMDKKAIMVTGCDSGFGRVFSLRMANKGVHVFASCMTERGKEEIEKSSPNITAFLMDITDRKSVKKAKEFVRNKLSTGRGLWGIMNNAGVLQTVLGPPEWQSDQEFKRLLDVNVIGQHIVTTEFLPLIKASRGRLAYTSSLAGFVPEPTMPLYVASKHAIEGYVSSIRAHMRHFGVSLHLVEPGIYKNSLTAPIVENIRKYFREMPEEIREEYNESYQEKWIDFIDSYFGSHPEDFTKVMDFYEHALFARFPRGRYNAQIETKLARILPEVFIDWILTHRPKYKAVPRTIH